MDGRQQRGNTIIEILVALALVSLVLCGFMLVYWTGNRVFNIQAADAEAQYMVRNATQKMEEDIRGASHIQIIGNGAQLGMVTGSGEVVNYYLHHNSIFRNGKAVIPIAESISYLSFDGDANLVEIAVEATVSGRPYRLNSSVHPRLYNAIGEDLSFP